MQGQRHLSGQWTVANEGNSADLYVRREVKRGEQLKVDDAVSQREQLTKDPYQDRELNLSGKIGDFSAHARWTTVRNQAHFVAGLVSNDWNFLNSDAQFINLEHAHAWSNGFSLETHLYNGRNQLRARSVPLAVPFILGEGIYTELEPGINQALRYEDSHHRLLLGWEFRRPRLTNSETKTSGAYISDYAIMPETSRTIRGIFPEWQYRFNESTSVLLATRYDAYSDFGSHTSPRAALIQQFNANNIVKLMYSEAFRSPSRSETGTQNSPIFVGNPNLKPETIKMSEVSWVHSQENNFFTATLYHALLMDGIVTVPVSPRTWRNGSDLSWNGMELEWQHQYGNWQVRGTYGQAFNSDLENNSQAEKLASVIFTFNGIKWDASLFTRYLGAQTLAYTAQDNQDINQYRNLGGKTIFGGHVNYLWQPQLNVYLHAENLLNRFYYAPADASSRNSEGVPQPGFAVMIGFIWNG